MAIVPSKRLVLIAFLLLCFVSTTARARNLREITKEGVEKGQSSEFKPNHEVAQTQEKNDDLLDTMDYTPASKNPPIHN
ncbi:root meristem growth factor 9-like [Trifolium medium]|uniref:Root meristem growth factor 9-like n=1 Tax=Trifolium medium TaxID=97028 RepID=A0A392MIX9_9FABA|nr:root meristem growth factor 9-like [Trifolium medium]